MSTWRRAGGIWMVMSDSDESDSDEFFAGVIGRAVASADRVLLDHAAAEDRLQTIELPGVELGEQNP